MSVRSIEAQARPEPKLRRRGGNAWLGAGLILAVGGGLGYGAAQAESLLGVQPPTGGSTYTLPVDSLQLTVTLQPLAPGPEVSATLAPPENKTRRAAAELAGSAGMERLGASLSALYPLGYRVAEPLTVPDAYFNFDRRQYNVDQVLTWLCGQCDPASFRTVGVLQQDIYMPGYNFLFGLAKCGGAACVASCARMSGLVAVPLMSPRQRWHSIVRHELGHTLGLPHVSDPRSVMLYGDSLEVLDKTGSGLTKADWAMLKALHPIRWQGR